MKKVLYICSEYPQLSETYIETEIREIRKQHEVKVISFREGEVKSSHGHPYTVSRDLREIYEAAKEFGPDFIHCHWLLANNIFVLDQLSRKLGIPFTIRAHSFDVLNKTNLKEDHIRALNSNRCRGILCFPFTAKSIENMGVNSEKLVPSPPVFDFSMFHNEEPNGEGVTLNGACLPKKRHADFIDLANLVPEKEFSLYPIGYDVEKVRVYNNLKGNPVNIFREVDHKYMPAIYKKNQWLVYPACPILNTVGWPVGILEAQASGVGVCMANTRPDLHDLVGGAGYMFDRIEDVADIIRKPLSNEMRERGFENAKNYDFQVHKEKLTSLWY
ncbi:MAG: hypothetical protein V7744_20040 [Pseudomonadales bacterium]